MLLTQDQLRKNAFKNVAVTTDYERNGMIVSEQLEIGQGSILRASLDLIM